MRDRLIELLRGFSTPICEGLNAKLPDVEGIADYLISESVIVPPCKVGQTLYFIYNSPHANKPNLTPRIYETNEWYFDIDEKGISILPRWVHGYNNAYHYYLGEYVFLTREEAEKALAEMQGAE